MSAANLPICSTGEVSAPNGRALYRTETVAMNLLLESDKETVCDVVCGHFGLAHIDLHKSTRVERISKPRQIVFYLLHRLTGATLTNIAGAFEMDHGTVRWGIEATCETMSVDRAFADNVVFLEDRCKLLLEAKK